MKDVTSKTYPNTSIAALSSTRTQPKQPYQDGERLSLIFICCCVLIGPGCLYHSIPSWFWTYLVQNLKGVRVGDNQGTWFGWITVEVIEFLSNWSCYKNSFDYCHTNYKYLLRRRMMCTNHIASNYLLKYPYERSFQDSIATTACVLKWVERVSTVIIGSESYNPFLPFLLAGF